MCLVFNMFTLAVHVTWIQIYCWYSKHMKWPGVKRGMLSPAVEWIKLIIVKCHSAQDKRSFSLVCLNKLVTVEFTEVVIILANWGILLRYAVPKVSRVVRSVEALWDAWCCTTLRLHQSNHCHLHEGLPCFWTAVLYSGWTGVQRFWACWTLVAGMALFDLRAHFTEHHKVSCPFPSGFLHDLLTFHS